MRLLILRTAMTLLVIGESALAAILLTPDLRPVAVAEVAVRVPDFSMRCDYDPPANFDVMVVEAAEAHGIDPRIVAATVYRESDCDVDALGGSGEIGLGQIHPRVWTRTLVEAGVIQHEADLWNARINLQATAFVLAHYHARSKGNLRDTFRRYNGAGPKAERYAREQVEAFTSMWIARR